MKGNPFKPTAGRRPPVLVGRKHALDVFREGIEDGSGAPGLLAFVTGPRGVGKTVLLSEAEDFARESGWAVISETAIPGLVARLVNPTLAYLKELGDTPPGRKITGISVAGIGITTQLESESRPSWREAATELCALLLERGTGLLVSIDEIHSIKRQELQELAAIVQHLIREELPIGLIMAGIPKAVSELLGGDVSTFLRRAEQIPLTDVSIDAVQEAFATTFRESGLEITDAQLRTAAEATNGYPFLIQLVGYHIWRLAEKTVTDENLEDGLEAARNRIGSLVLAPALSNLSDVDRTFLLKMSEDDGPSLMRDIATRLGKEGKYAWVYRQRLMDANVIESAGRGLVDFAIPDLREYLREHAASLMKRKLPR